MFNLDSISQHRKKHGYYIVDGETHNNKFVALSKKTTDSNFKFYFNDDVFSQFDWSIEPDEDLYELYRQRALQLRKTYDYLVLYFSGGIDSITILRTFLDNDIKLDGIVVYGTWKLDQKYQHLNLDVIEQNKVGVPYLQSLEKQYNKNLNYHLLDTTDFYHNFQDENWVFSCNTFLGPRMFCHNFYWQDPWMQEWLNKGNTAFIRGIDKPRVLLKNNKWHLGFLDVQCIDSSPSGVYDKRNDYAITEYFFWTPDFPKLISKQCHTVINYFENNLSSSALSRITTKTDNFDQALYYKYVDPLIYGRYTPQAPGEDKPYFSLPKSIAPTLVQKDLWFYQTGSSEMKREFDIWKKGINHLTSLIDPSAFNITKNKSTELPYNQWINGIYKEFNLDGVDIPKIGEPHVLWGTVGTWAQLHPIRNKKLV
jgi:hypothetical protein